MRFFLVLFAVVVAVVASPPQSRIVGGNVAAEAQFPHQASVRDFENEHLCGGWIHTVKWIVSAAHCTNGRSISNTMVVVGTNSLTQGGFEYELSRIINHPGFNSGMDNNLSLLEILHEIDLYPNVRPIPIAGQTPVTSRTTAVVTGWGRTEQDGPLANTLNWVALRTLTNAECRERHTIVYREYINDAKLCTDNSVGVGMCTGDSGNALVSGGVVIGTTSWGHGGCGAGFPDVYTRMAYYVPWVNGIINSV